MSWQFEGAPPLAVSIETRKRRGQEYSAVQGFFKQYELIYVVADERDVVRLRTNYRGEQVYLYRLNGFGGAGPGAAHGLCRQHQRAGRTAAVLQCAHGQLHDQHPPPRHTHQPERTTVRLADDRQRVRRPASLPARHRGYAPAVRRVARAQPHQRQSHSGGSGIPLSRSAFAKGCPIRERRRTWDRFRVPSVGAGTRNELQHLASDPIGTSDARDGPHHVYPWCSAGRSLSSAADRQGVGLGQDANPLRHFMEEGYLFASGGIATPGSVGTSREGRHRPENPYACASSLGASPDAVRLHLGLTCFASSGKAPAASSSNSGFTVSSVMTC